jgi:hypothetical protein
MLFVECFGGVGALLFVLVACLGSCEVVLEIVVGE